MKKPAKPRNKQTKRHEDDFATCVFYFPEIKENQESRQFFCRETRNSVAILVSRIRDFVNSFRRSRREA